MKLAALFAVGLGLGGCTAEDRRRPAPPAKPPTPPALANATQTDLAKELDAAERLGTWNEVKARWQGQTLRWTVTRQRALCHQADNCNVAAFPIQRPALHGWLPTLEFAPGQFAALEARCGKAEQCEIAIEGTLSKLQVSDAMPTNVTLTNVKLIETKATQISAK